MNADERSAHLNAMTKKYSAYGLTFTDVDTSQKSHMRYTYIVNGNQYVNTENEITWMLGIWGNKRRSFEKSKAEVFGYWRRNHDLLLIAHEKGIISSKIVAEIMGNVQKQVVQSTPESIDPKRVVQTPTTKTEIQTYDLDPEFISGQDTLNEGATMRVMVNRYERNHTARERCIALKGCKCAVCGMDFGRMYGSIGEGFIHVHHTIPISSIGKDYSIDYANDLVPVCPNCHSMMHRKDPPYSVDEMKTLLTNKK